MTGNEIRARFLSFFARNGHAVVASSGLIPANDPTLLFTNAGMVQFKDVFLGREKRPYTRACSSQKCVRAGGKHNDLENVGRTARHHTFFEMLGNFSFGDYFKEEAIVLAWAFVTEELGLPPERLLATVYAEDEEAYGIWRTRVGLPEDRVLRIATHDNFWSMGDTGPCGPCSEIFYDHGEQVPGGPPGSADENGDRFVEIWNLVFMQYDRDASGRMTPLPAPSIDTGAGLERLAAILQGSNNNYDSDLFKNLIDEAARVAGVRYGDDPQKDISLRVIADHMRAMGFLITDQVLPSNVGRGYVLRRIMRRAMRHGRMLGLTEPFLHTLLPSLVATMGEAFPALAAQKATTAMIIAQEEKRFAATLGVGLKILEEALEALPPGHRQLDGATIFTLYDTYGFPTDLTADIVRDRGIALDMAGFEAHMAEQRRRARAAWAGSGEEAVAGLYHELLETHGASEFLGYVTESAQGEVVALLDEQGVVERLEKGQKGRILANQTPFYGESGGQVGDVGVVVTASGRFRVTGSQKPLPELIIHLGHVEEGYVTSASQATFSVDPAKRQAIRLHHSATHLLHHALRVVLGEHVKQAGSMVSSERLRFDFSHFKGMSPEDIEQVEEWVNRAILANGVQETTVMTPDEAVEAGAMALFGEKYGDEVRVVRIGDSMELCGGTHVRATGDIGLFKVVAESAVAAGVRRIEGVCGHEARRHYRLREMELKRAAEFLKTKPEAVSGGILRLLERQRELERELAQAKSAMAGNVVDEIVARKQSVGGVSVIVERLDDFDPKGLRELMDRVKDHVPSSVILLGVAGEGRVSLIAGVSQDLLSRIKAGDLIKFTAPLVGGKGGGRPDMAQGGGAQPEKLADALSSAARWINDQLR